MCNPKTQSCLMTTTGVPDFAFPLWKFADYELRNVATLKSVYETFEPDEFCPFTTEKKGKCADAEDVYCCVNPFATPDGNNGKPTGQYCLTSLPQIYHAYRPIFRGFQLNIDVQVSIPGQSLKVFNLSSMYRSQQVGNSSVTFIRDRLTLSSQDSLLIFEEPVREGLDLNATKWFAMDLPLFYSDRRLSMSSRDWYQRVQKDPLFCASSDRWIAATNGVDRTDQFLPLKEDEDAKYYFDPNYKLATLTPARYVDKNYPSKTDYLLNITSIFPVLAVMHVNSLDAMCSQRTCTCGFDTSQSLIFCF